MDSGIIRDYLIIIGGGLILLTIVVTGILGFVLYSRIKSLTKSIKQTVHMTQELGNEIKEAARSAKEITRIFKPGPAKSESKTSNKTGVGSAT